jgi:hypothetical protein
MLYRLIGLLCCLSYLAAANGVAAQPNTSKLAVSCARARSGSITAALTCTDEAEAMRQLDESGCFARSAHAVVEVRDVWLARESLPANAAARDREIQLFMAGCLVEAHSKTQPPDAAEISAVGFLRRALVDTDAQVAGIAMMALAPVLSQDDIDMIVKQASVHATLVMPAVTALSFPCTVASAIGVAKIQSVYAGSLQAEEGFS